MMAVIKCVLLDIEGTVCPISFVKDTLFPYALRALPSVLSTHWSSETFRPYRDAFPPEHSTSPAVLQAHVEDLTKRDVKVAYLKNLQGYLWEEGYASGAYATDLFPDVVPKLREWRDEGNVLAIYSSGSVFAQKLLFGHVNVGKEAENGEKRKRVGDAGKDGGKVAKREETGGKNKEKEALVTESVDESKTKSPTTEREEQSDTANSAQDSKPSAAVTSTEPQTENLTSLFTDWFDTTNAGLKTESASYTKIASALRFPASKVLFLSDNIKEVDAAIAAGMQSILVDRPGNAQLAQEDRERVDLVESLADVKV